MKKISSLLLAALLAATFGRAGESLTKPADAYAQAVAAYVEAANHEMVALHAKVDLFAKKADDDAKAKCADIDHQLDECDKILEQLTAATRSSFDRIKSAYERERGDATKALDELTKT